MAKHMRVRKDVYTDLRRSGLTWDQWVEGVAAQRTRSHSGHMSHTLLACRPPTDTRISRRRCRGPRSSCPPSTNASLQPSMGAGLILQTMPSNLHPSRASLDIVGSARRGGITSLTVDVPTPYHHSKSPPRWRTPEFFVYYVFFVVVVPWMAWVPVSLSSSTHLVHPRSFRACTHAPRAVCSVTQELQPLSTQARAWMAIRP